LDQNPVSVLKKGTFIISIRYLFDCHIDHKQNSFFESIISNEFICNMSRKGNCWDNAPLESFWGKLKSEWLSKKNLRRLRKENRNLDYIELFYNRDRIHLSND
jgi:putative transposase